MEYFLTDELGDSESGKLGSVGIFLAETLA